MASSLLSRILGIFGRAAKEAATDVLAKEVGRRTGSRSSPGSAAPSAAKGGSRSGAAPSGSRGPGVRPRPSDPGPASPRPARDVEVYDVVAAGLPDLTYTPREDGLADPGEVVWTWVPYEEDASQGKDRPVLVLSRVRGRLVVAQMTSKDHDRDAEQEARWGRYWFDVGTGEWDRRSRPSEVRLDRLLSVAPSAVRRQGAALDRLVFEAVVRALREHWQR